MNTSPSYNSLRCRYAVKSILPRRAVLQIRQAIARRKLSSAQNVWPILQSAGAAPPWWTGWPEDRQFAFLISHDVDTQRGLDRCLQIADLEERLGFRSAFYFVPKGRYAVPKTLREELVRRGFEVGVHGLYHDWRTFMSRPVFEKRAPRINYYLKDWRAAGFRAPSMIRNLDWIRELNVDYDASTFDTDPFEPQSEGAGTIFPYWIDGTDTRPGFVELPYTLPQDYTLFVLLQAKGIDVWKHKLDWIAKKGGMAFCDVHPCYADPAAGLPAYDAYPLSYYEAFLDLMKNQYKGQYWHVLPREIAQWWRSRAARVKGAEPVRPVARKIVSHQAEKIWIDLDNTPHVPFFRPIIRELKARGFDVLVTARDAFQVWELADRMGVDCAKIGRHYGKHKILKGIGLCYRAAQLAPLIQRERPILAVSHGSRSQVILSSLLRIPCVTISDYEHARGLPVFHSTYHIVPDVIPDSAVQGNHGAIFHYPGIKENVYAPDFVPDSILLHELGLRADETIVAVRPPATEAHYRAQLSDVLFDATMSFLLGLPEIRIVLVPRNKKQNDFLAAARPAWFSGDKTIVPSHAVDGMNLLWHSDVVISGGGTMNREAAALGVPVYSIFGGAIGAVDQYLSDIGKLIIIRNPDDLPARLRIRKRDKIQHAVDSDRQTLRTIVSHIVDMAENSTAHLI
ncbi:MAG: DUF354 domain-containing protein [bacterium]